MNIHYEIYCDMDGVIANWLGGVAKVLGKEYIAEYYNQKEHEKERADLLGPLGPTFWANLEPMPDYEELWGYLTPLNPFILTAHPTWCEVNAYNAKVGKVLWNQKWTQVTPERLLITTREEKKNWAMKDGQPNVLIDDYKKNCKQWEAAGGIAIHHKSAAQTIERLNELRR